MQNYETMLTNAMESVKVTDKAQLAYMDRDMLLKRMNTIKNYCEKKDIGKLSNVIANTIKQLMSEDIEFIGIGMGENTRRVCLQYLDVCCLLSLRALFGESIKHASRVVTETHLVDRMMKKRLFRNDEAELGDIGVLPREIREIIGGYL